MMVSLCLAGLTALVMGATLYLTWDRVESAMQAIQRSETVLRSVGQVENQLDQLDRAQRALLQTGGDTSLAQRRDGAIDGLEATFDALASLRFASPHQQKFLPQLGGAVRALRPGAAAANANTAAAIDSIRSMLTAMEKVEIDVLEAGRAQEHESVDAALLMLGVGLLVIVLLFGADYWTFHRQNSDGERLERRFSDMVQALPVSLWRMRTGPDGVHRFEFIFDNAKVFSEADIVEAGHSFAPVMRIIVPEDQAIVTRSMAEALQALVPLSVDCRIQLPGGRLRSVHIAATLRPEPDGSVVWNGYCGDITDRLEMEAMAHSTETANAANRAKSSFLAAMSHEIRTPMNGVLGLLELLSLTPLDDRQRSTLSVVCESARSLLRIIDDILDFSKIEANRLEIHPVPASVFAVVDRARQIHSGNASSKGLLLHARVDPAIGACLRFDPLRLGQILNNFLSNAIKFTDAGSVNLEVQLAGREDGLERLRFIVTDTGIGITEQQQARLFQPFMQGDDGIASRFGGTGLGLVICRRLSELMGGTTEMASEPGRGTSLTLSLAFPVADAAELPKPESAGLIERLNALVARRRPAPTQRQAEAEGSLLLVVDDHPTNRMVLRSQVNSLGYACVTAADGREALQAWRSGRFAALITDCNMPEMSGYELARAIRREEAGSAGTRLPIIACTANALDTAAAVCADAGMDDYLVKPVTLSELSQRLDRWLPLPRAEADAAAPAVQ
jgi:signal transduction histidine kinase/ActR/RegA family two-component response regulator